MPSPRIAILTPAKGVYEATWPVVLSRLESALSATGVEVVPTPWTDHVADAAGLAGFDLVLPLLTWGYHLDHARWRSEERRVGKTVNHGWCGRSMVEKADRSG